MSAAPRTRVRIVQSRQNARVKALSAVLARPTAAAIGLEGLHLVQEALRSGLEVQTIFVRTGSESLLDVLEDALLGKVGEIVSIPDTVLRNAVTTEAPQGVAAIVTPPEFTLRQILHKVSRVEARTPAQILLVVLAGLQDPGNVGTIVRSAEAFGADGILALPGTASVWNAKSLRASMGSAFRLPVVSVSLGQAITNLNAHRIASLAAVAPGAGPHQLSHAADLCRATALWIGNEGAGLAPEHVAACDATVTIPYPGPVESLNAATAAAVLLYEAARQRLHTAEPSAMKAHPKAV